jgi:polyvinyl alcohol dehydrogenase (cytochrome)
LPSSKAWGSGLLRFARNDGGWWGLVRLAAIAVLSFAAPSLAEPITQANVAKLHPIWSVAMQGASRGMPVSDGRSLYVGNTTGYLYRIDRKTGEIVWQIELAAKLDIPGAAAAKIVALTEHAVIFGLHNKPVVVALDKDTGALLWKTVVDDHPGAVISQTPLIDGKRLFIGVSGLGEEVGATTPPYQCCSFRGSVLSLDVATGKILWKHYTVPPNFAGGSVWSSLPVLDARRHALYITTGNAFKAPPEVQACVEANKADPAKVPACYPADVWYDSILALDPDSGAVKWGFRAEQADIFTGACLVKIGGYCGGGEDFDFGNGALTWRAGARDFVGAGQKSGTFWALNPDTGKPVWQSKVGPGGPTGGIEYGSAVDGSRIYVAEGNTKQVGHDAASYTLPSGQTINYGSYAALDAATGRIIWQVPDPAGARNFDNGKPCNRDSPRENCFGAYPKGAVTVANGVVYGCSTAPNGPFYAFDAATGKMLWTYEGGVGCDTKAAAIDDAIYWIGGKTVYAFSLAPVQAAKTVEAGVTFTRTVHDGVYSADQAARGKALYVANCSTGCHNENLTGSGPTPSLAGPDFLARWSGLGLDVLLKRIATTMPKTNPGSLAEVDDLAVVAYLLSANGFPAGRQALGGDAEMLRTTAIGGAAR